MRARKCSRSWRPPARRPPAAKDPRRCESVTLYQGGQYFLYHYKRYDDVRMVFAPEYAVAAFGGDPDNFQFPRWCLDMSVLRAYENGKPAATPNYLKFNWNGPQEKELVFVTGHPGSTDRQLTVAQLQAQRAELPFWLQRASELRGRYIQFGKTGAENERIVADPLNGLENSLKVRRKELDALLDESLMASKVAAEKAAARALGHRRWRRSVGGYRKGHGARPAAQHPLCVHRVRGRTQQLAVPLCAHAGARRRRARQAQRRAVARNTPSRHCRCWCSS